MEGGATDPNFAGEAGEGLQPGFAVLGCCKLVHHPSVHHTGLGRSGGFIVAQVARNMAYVGHNAVAFRHSSGGCVDDVHSSEENGEKDHGILEEGLEVPRVLGFELEKDLFWMNALGVILIIIVVLFPTFFLRAVFGIPFVLFFPGYALVCALFPKKMDLDEVERLALSIGLSIAVVPLLGLVLNYTPFGIRLYPILVSLFSFTLLMSLVAMRRRKALSVKDRFTPSFSVNIPRWQELSKMDKTLSVGLISCVVLSGALVANFAATPRVGERFTEFYVLGPTGKVEGYPTTITLGESGTVILGVVNHEYDEVAYRIVVRLDGETVGTMEGIGLEHEEKWEQNFTFTPNKTGEKLKLEFLLYKEGGDEPYRSLHLWITVRAVQ